MAKNMHMKRKSTNRTMNSREERNREVPAFMRVIQALLYSYVVTSIILFIVAFLMYRFHLNENVIAVSIIITYIVSTFIGGFSLGKFMKEKKYLWGIVLGILYVSLLLLITLGVYRTLNHDDIVTTLVLCIGSGCIGGMVS